MRSDDSGRLHSGLSGKGQTSSWILMNMTCIITRCLSGMKRKKRLLELTGLVKEMKSCFNMVSEDSIFRVFSGSTGGFIQYYHRPWNLADPLLYRNTRKSLCHYFCYGKVYYIFF